MAKTYAEFLVEQGATAEELAVLDTPTARKAYMRMQADNDAKVVEYETRVKAWHEKEVVPYQAKLAQEAALAKSEAAAERARTKELQDAGLIAVAAKQDAATTVNNGSTPEAFDPKKYNLLTADSLATALDPFAKGQGKAMVTLTKIMREHDKLGLPDCDFGSLYDESIAAGKQFPDYWNQKFGVEAKRAEVAAKDKTAYEERLRKEGREAYIKENGSIMPGSGAPRSSGFSFTTKKAADGKDATQPWLQPESARADAAIQKALNKVGN
jgi:hypothetical protein